MFIHCALYSGGDKFRLSMHLTFSRAVALLISHLSDIYFTFNQDISMINTTVNLLFKVHQWRNPTVINVRCTYINYDT